LNLEGDIHHYIENLIPERDAVLARLEVEAQAEQIPIVQLSSIQLIRTLLLAYQPKRILELGTAIGYSTIWLAQASSLARITTMEIDQARIARAITNLEEAGVRERVELVEADAGEGLPSHYRFDCIFIDAAKGQYQAYLDLYLPHLEPGGIVICDNVLFRGYVASDAPPVNKRLLPLVKKLQQFNQGLFAHPELESSLIPIGDGLALCVKKSPDN
jgi:predicted O-methyltransferase YrrM